MNEFEGLEDEIANRVGAGLTEKVEKFKKMAGTIGRGARDLFAGGLMAAMISCQMPTEVIIREIEVPGDTIIKEVPVPGETIKIPASLEDVLNTTAMSFYTQYVAGISVMVHGDSTVKDGAFGLGKEPSVTDFHNLCLERLGDAVKNGLISEDEAKTLRATWNEMFVQANVVVAQYETESSMEQ